MLHWLAFLSFRLKGFDRRPEAIMFALFFDFYVLYSGVGTPCQRELHRQELHHDFAPPVLLSHSR